MSEKPKYFIYKTTNLLNGKIYIGQHKHNKCNYFGSGTYILKALKKHGRENFKRETLFECDNISDLNEKESYYIKLYNSTDLRIGYNFIDVAFCPIKMTQTVNYKKNHKQAVADFAKSEKGKRNHAQHSELMKKRFKNTDFRKQHSEKLKKIRKQI